MRGQEGGARKTALKLKGTVKKKIILVRGLRLITVISLLPLPLRSSEKEDNPRKGIETYSEQGGQYVVVNHVKKKIIHFL